MMFGEDYWVCNDDPGCRFSAWTHAEERRSELATRAAPELRL